MGFLLPAALGLLLLAVPIILLYMLRLRRQDVAVSSSYLWRRALMDRTANMPWNRLRRNLLLLLQLLLLLLLVFSLARPFFEAKAVASGNLVVILDGSASMQATDERGGESRFERARQEADALIDGMSGDARTALVWAGPVSQVAAAASGDKAALHSVLSHLQASNGSTDIAQAVTLGAAVARQLGSSTLVLISDGAFPSGSSLPTAPGKTAYINVGKSGRNIGITALSLRDAAGGPQLFASVLNSGGAQADALLSISVDGKLRDSRKLILQPGQEQPVTLGGLPLDTKTVMAHITSDSAADVLAADNTAWAVMSRPRSANVLLVTEGDSFLEKSLNVVPNIKLFKTTLASYAPSDGFGLTVLDGAAPSPLPSGNLLLFAPPSSALVPVSGTLSYPVVGQVDVNDPLLRFVDLSSLHIAEAQRITAPSWARVLVRSAAGDPLIMAGETGGRRVVVVGFDLHKSDLPLQVAFPILISNLIVWLQPQSSVSTLASTSPGDPVSIQALPEADELRVTLPEGTGGRQTILRPTAATSFADTNVAGIYSVQQFAGGEPLADPERFAVNVPASETNVEPHPELAFKGTQNAIAPAGSTTRPLEVWPWVLGVSLLILLVEWWYYNRGFRQGMGRKPTANRAKRQAP